MRVLFTILSFSFSLMIAQDYCAGDQISLSDQNIEYIVAQNAGNEEYSSGDIFKLSDLNGDLNGGKYHVIFIDMSETWWGPCYQNVPVVDGLATQFSDEYNFIVLNALGSTLPNSQQGQYTAQQWQNLGVPNSPLIIDADESGSPSMVNLFYDSWGGATPTYALIDHTMTVRAKPFPLNSNGNPNQSGITCDGTNSTVNGWSGGSTSSFIQQLLDECGPQCLPCNATSNLDSDGDGIFDECDDCSNIPGDVSDNLTIAVEDIIIVVNIILSGGISSSDFDDCQKSDADLNGDNQISVLDIIRIINIILS